MDANNISCPVCTLYLRPGITLKNHLSSHPKQKVIEALVRLAETDDVQKIGNSSQSDAGSSISSQVNTAIVNQSWNQGNLVNMPPSIPPLQGNHLFIYQQSMSSTTTPQQNVLNVNPPSQQYVIPTVLNPQMMPYIYQQQVIMSSGSCLSPMRTLPFELPPSTSTADSATEQTDCSTTDHSSSESDQEQQKKSENEAEESNSEPQISTDTNNASDKAVCVESIKNDCELQEQMNNSLDLEVYEMEDLQECPESGEVEQNYNNLNENESPRSPAGSDKSFKVDSDLNKACQTQNTNNLSPASVLQDEDVLEDVEPSKQSESDFYFINEADNNPAYTSVDLGQNYDQSNPIYTASNILQSTDHLDFVDMDGMHMVINEINDFSTSQIISQVENFEGSAPDRPGVLMTIGGMIDNSKDDFLDQRDAEESMSRESSNVNIRADERMPPRGELSGQESIGGSSDITWNRVQYNEGSSVMSTSYDLLARESWEASDSSDVEVPPLQSRIPPHVSYPENDDNDTPTIVSFTGPPLNFKCSSCEEAFACLKDRKEHEAEKHPEKARKPNSIGTEIGKKKVKKLVVKLKSDKAENENNFDNVFTNKLKMETSLESESAEVQSAEEPVASVKSDESSLAVELKTVCPICDCVLLNAKALREHKLNVHNVTSQTRHKCLTCDEVFPNDYKFSEHLRIHPLECKICGRLFYRRQNIQLHMRRHLGIKPYKCDVCEKSFLTKQKLDEHRNIHTGEAPIKCSLCDETFRRHSNLVQHRNRHHLNVKKKVKDYICFCKEIFHSKKKLAWHKEIHDAKPKSCTHCNEKFIHMSSLTRHMRRAHNDRFLPKGHKSPENVECPICKGVYLKSSLEVHIRNHSGQRPFACLICNKDFTTKWNLKLHKWTHASRVSKPFKCDQCKGAFIRESDYVAHMNSHKSIRPYTCNHCGAQFIRKYNCQRHVKEHENEKMFNCKVCGKSFHRSYYLKDHMRIHSGLRPYSCHICGKTSTTKSNHNKHVQIHHAREPVSTEN
ncbi:zf-H2C2 2 domain containing protein [Asbolus verrucosus]|uniref:Zf-H2C2 2 domain containing protein n=1 Tax=Asbolus verrucosus TaxID=1661398 RepID=A0A482VCE0_ASBVE|nr:zf-H2C2 2 domain containing protein [Asbolus verrucosus]